MGLFPPFDVRLDRVTFVDGERVPDRGAAVEMEHVGVPVEEVVAAVDGRAEVLLDGGVRRGADVLKALALGARSVLIGRAMVWGLAAAGEDGVADVLRLLRDEIELGLGLLGCTSPDEVTRAHVS